MPYCRAYDPSMTKIRSVTVASDSRSTGLSHGSSAATGSAMVRTDLNVFVSWLSSRL